MWRPICFRWLSLGCRRIRLQSLTVLAHAVRLRSRGNSWLLMMMTERGGLELTEIPRDVTPPLPALLLGGKYSRLLHVRQRSDVIVEPEPIRKGLTKSETSISHLKSLLSARLDLGVVRLYRLVVRKRLSRAADPRAARNRSSQLKSPDIDERRSVV